MIFLWFNSGLIGTCKTIASEVSDNTNQVCLLWLHVCSFCEVTITSNAGGVIFVILISFKISLANIMCTHSEGVLGDLNADTLNYRWPKEQILKWRTPNRWHWLSFMNNIGQRGNSLLGDTQSRGIMVLKILYI